MAQVIVKVGTVLVCCAALIGSGMIIGEYVSREKQTPKKGTGAPGDYKEVQFDPTDYDPRTAADRMPAIVKFPVKLAADVGKEVLDDELVLGVEVGGQFRAYPINQMTGPSREVFNDVLGETPIAATW